MAHVGLLEGYDPFRLTPKKRDFGGLAHTVAALNSLLAAALAGIIIASTCTTEIIAIVCAKQIAIFVGALIVFGVSLCWQIILIKNKEECAKNKLEEQPEITPNGSTC